MLRFRYRKNGLWMQVQNIFSDRDVSKKFVESVNWIAIEEICR